MNIGPSRIGRQESAAMAGVSLFTATVFTVDSQQAYSAGNSSYIWMSLSILVSLAAAMAIMSAMEKSGADTLDKLFTAAFGKTAGRIAAIPLILLFIASAFLILTDFVNMIHSFVFYNSGYWEIALWVLLTSLLLSFMGLECISRTTLLILPIFAAALLAALLIPYKSYAVYRLSPFPGNSLWDMGRLALYNLPRAFGAMMALLTVTDRLCGMRFARSSCVIGAVCAAALTALTQLAIGMAYDYIDLADMLFPLYRMEMIMTEEGYIFRMDNLSLFFWLMAGITTAAYYIYSGSMLWCRCFGPKDTRPGTVAFTVITGCAVLMQSEGHYDEFRALYYGAGRWGWIVISLPLIAAAVLSVRRGMAIRSGRA